MTSVDIVDTHTHIVSPDSSTHPIAPGMGGDDRWYEDHPITGDALLSLMDATDVSQVIFVQAMSCYGYDNRYVIECARRYRTRARAVGIVRPGDEAARRVAADELARGDLAGVRLFAVGDRGLDDPHHRPVIELSQRAGTPVLIMTTAAHLAGVPGLVEQFPDVEFVLDHCGFADPASASKEPDLGALSRLFAASNLSFKVSSIVLRATADPARLVRSLADAVGAHRLLWGSDFPHTFGDGYRSLVELGRHATASLNSAEAREFSSGTARRLWRW